MRFTQEIRAGLSPVIDLIYPPRCPHCGVAIAQQDGLCIDCWGKLETLGEDQGEGADHAGEGVRAACVYNDVSRDLVLRFKHGGKVALARLMARMMASQLEEAGPGSSPLLVPVPLHRWRLWERGYNQSALLARELAALGKGELCVDALLRAKRTPSLGGLGKDERERALEGAIIVSSGRVSAVVDRDIVLVDDVYTSGATSAACAKALRDAGARSVIVVCFARVAEY